MFRKIGQYEIRTEGDDVLVVWSSSEFNLEAAQEYASHVLQMIERMPTRFGVLARFDGSPVLAPEVEAAMHRSAGDRARRGMCRVALFSPVTDGLAIARMQWQRIYEGTGVVHTFFTDEHAARAWLRSELDSLRDAR